MRIFRRSLSSGSGASTTRSASSDPVTPRTSIDSNDHDHIEDAKDGQDKAPKVQMAPLLSLPIELVQHVTTYLDAWSSASFSLTSRYIYYALGPDCVTLHVNEIKSRFLKRRTIEALVERAFPGHWFCAWCDIFHSCAPSTGPRDASGTGTKHRECLDSNSHLPAGSDYILRYHHVRLAINHALRGPEHGIPLSAFSHTQASMALLSRTPVPTKLDVSAKIVSGRFLLHTSFAIILPAWCTSRKNLISSLWPAFPHILTGHRDTENGHTGLMAAIDNVVRRGWKYPFTQNCATCSTDWSVNSHFFAHATGGQTRLVVQTWRDLGDGRNPFDTAWRAHGVSMHAAASDVVRVTGLQAGDVRKAFETSVHEYEPSSTVRAVSPARMRIYQTFMRKEQRGTEVRRSRARPNTWRTSSENEEVARREEEERIEDARQVMESLVRWEEEMGRV